MNEDTKITFWWAQRKGRKSEVLCEETRTLKEWTGLTAKAMEGWSVLHLDAVLGQVMRDWVSAQHNWGFKLVEDQPEPVKSLFGPSITDPDEMRRLRLQSLRSLRYETGLSNAEVMGLTLSASEKAVLKEHYDAMDDEQVFDWKRHR